MNLNNEFRFEARMIQNKKTIYSTLVLGFFISANVIFNSIPLLIDYFFNFITMNNTNQSLKDFLDTTGCIKKGMMVSMPLIPQMEVYGFVVIGKQEQAIEMFCSAISEGKSDCILPFGPVEVYGDRVLFKSVDKNMPNRLPIFSEVNRQ